MEIPRIPILSNIVDWTVQKFRKPPQAKVPKERRLTVSHDDVPTFPMSSKKVRQGAKYLFPNASKRLGIKGVSWRGGVWKFAAVHPRGERDEQGITVVIDGSQIPEYERAEEQNTRKVRMPAIARVWEYVGDFQLYLTAVRPEYREFNDNLTKLEQRGPEMYRGFLDEFRTWSKVKKNGEPSDAVIRQLALQTMAEAVYGTPSNPRASLGGAVVTPLNYGPVAKAFLVGNPFPTKKFAEWGKDFSLIEQPVERIDEDGRAWFNVLKHIKPSPISWRKDYVHYDGLDFAYWHGLILSFEQWRDILGKNVDIILRGEEREGDYFFTVMVRKVARPEQWDEKQQRMITSREVFAKIHAELRGISGANWTRVGRPYLDLAFKCTVIGGKKLPPLFQRHSVSQQLAFECLDVIPRVTRRFGEKSGKYALGLMNDRAFLRKPAKDDTAQIAFNKELEGGLIPDTLFLEDEEVQSILFEGKSEEGGKTVGALLREAIINPDHFLVYPFHPNRRDSALYFVEEVLGGTVMRREWPDAKTLMHRENKKKGISMRLPPDEVRDYQAELHLQNRAWLEEYVEEFTYPWFVRGEPVGLPHIPDPGHPLTVSYLQGQLDFMDLMQEPIDRLYQLTGIRLREIWNDINKLIGMLKDHHLGMMGPDVCALLRQEYEDRLEAGRHEGLRVRATSQNFKGWEDLHPGTREKHSRIIITGLEGGHYRADVEHGGGKILVRNLSTWMPPALISYFTPTREYLERLWSMRQESRDIVEPASVNGDDEGVEMSERQIGS